MPLVSDSAANLYADKSDCLVATATNWSNTYDIYGRDYHDGELGKNSFRNYAREYVLSDGSMGIDTTSTKNSNPLLIPSDITDGIDLSTINFT